MVQAIRPLNGRYLTTRDLDRHAVVTDDVHKCPTRVVSVENTAGGTIVPLAEMRRLHAWTRRHPGVSLHVDGARLWEAASAAAATTSNDGGSSGSSSSGEGAGDMRQLGSCCDVLTLDFSKNLGAPMGAMVLGSAGLMARLRRLRKSVGGGMRQAGVLAAAARRAVVENFGPGPADTRGVIRRSHVLAGAVAAMWAERGGRLLREVETNMVWLDLRAAGVTAAEWNEAGRRHGVRLDGKRVVLHHQVSGVAITRLAAAMDDVLRQRRREDGRLDAGKPAPRL